ncbi:hypothetical protein B6I21_04685 [candidate division KSB1 bacterium 4572_119]|nr:MAG: hypothetical protein B6I21_04685 [candidate division KSB1 bacterium 4572_119]
MKYKLPEFTILSQPYLEFGLVHRPWLDFEEKINRYRVQGTLFLERSELLNSADFGMLLVANIGGKLDNKIQNKIGTKHTGKFGSFGIGVFNGGGYHAIEQNTNKVLETRLTLRPFHGFFPGLLFSYFGAFGKGNTELAPDWVLNSGFVSLENRYFVLTGTYYEGKGNSFGSCIDENNRPLNQSGYSAFSELKLMCNRVSIFGRYDFFAIEDETGDTKNERYIVGTAYHFERGCKILLDYDYGKLVNSEETKDSLFELAIEIVF